MLALRGMRARHFVLILALGMAVFSTPGWAQDGCGQAFQFNRWVASAPPTAEDPRDPTEEEKKLLDETQREFQNFISAAGLRYRKGMRVQLYEKGQDHYKHLSREIALIVPKGAVIDIRVLLHELSHGIFDENYESEERLLSVAMSMKGGQRLAPWQVAYDELFADACAYAASGLDSKDQGRGFTRNPVTLDRWQRYEEHELFGPVRTFLGDTSAGDHLLHEHPSEQGRVLKRILRASAQQEGAFFQKVGNGDRMKLEHTPAEINREFLQILEGFK